MDDLIPRLRDACTKAESKVARLRAQLATAEQEVEETATAIRVLERLNGTAVDPAGDTSALILKFVGTGKANGRAPKDVRDLALAEGIELNPDQVRTNLWRMAKRGSLISADGKYWRAEAGDAPITPLREEPAAAAPLQRNPIAASFDDDLDDDVPF